MSYCRNGSEMLAFATICTLLMHQSVSANRDFVFHKNLISVDSNAAAADPGSPHVTPQAKTGTFTDSSVVQLCECEKAVGNPGGLSCTKEGWFITSFENQGTWMGGGGLVPLSHAICCRPCLPDALPNAKHSTLDGSQLPDSSNTGSAGLQQVHAETRQTHDETQHPSESDHVSPRGQLTTHPQENPKNLNGPAVHKPEVVAAQLLDDIQQLSSGQMQASVLEQVNDEVKPVGVVSWGCHPSSGRSYNSLSCELLGASYVTGFTRAEQVSAFYPDIYYPLGSVTCCTPALLMSNGETVPLQRCNCIETYTRECGGTTTHRLLWGFNDWRMNRDGDFLPVAPLQCCQLCMPSRPALPNEGCQELNMCSGTGVCVQGSCMCYQGWGGPDCSISQRAGMDSLLDMPWWAMCLAIVGLGLCVCSTSVAARVTFEGLRGTAPQVAHPAGNNQPPQNADRDSLTVPLLYALLDDAGSAGSRDTDQESEQDEEPGDEAADEDNAVQDGEAVAPQGSQRLRAMGRRAVRLAERVMQAVRAQAEVEADTADGGEETGDVEAATGGEQATEVVELVGTVEPHATPTGPEPLAVVNGTTDGTISAVDEGTQQQGQSISGHGTGMGNGGQAGSSVGSGAATRTTNQLRIANGNHGHEGHRAQQRHLDAARAIQEEIATERTTERPHATSDDAHQHEVDIECDHDLGRSEEETEQRIGQLGATCIVCMETPVQVVLVPCGHASVCRRCSRRLTHCPMCRQLIHRRQRLYIGSS